MGQGAHIWIGTNRGSAEGASADSASLRQSAIIIDTSCRRTTGHTLNALRNVSATSHRAVGNPDLGRVPFGTSAEGLKVARIRNARQQEPATRAAHCGQTGGLSDA